MSWESNRVKRKTKRAVITVAVVAFLSVIVNLVVSNCFLVAKKYDVEADNAPQVRIVFATDLHIGTSRISTEKMTEKMKSASPDIICLTGDIIDSDDTDTRQRFYAFLKDLASAAPVYYSLGNHELDIIKNGCTELKENIEACGVKVLDDSYVDIDINGSSLRLGGMLDDIYNFYYKKKEFESSPRAAFLRDFSATERYTVMLCHRSDSFDNYKKYGVKIADLVLSGHTHGGVVRVPFGKAVYVPDMGWFKKNSYGVVKENGSEMIVSSGTASHGRLLRFNNPCEICVIDIKGNADG